MTKNEFFEQYKDPRWQKKRLEIMQRDEFQCQNCFDGENTLNVHHKYYISGRKVWDYPSVLLVTLCERCHQAEEECKDIQSDFTRILLSEGYLNNQLVYLLKLLQRLPSGDIGMAYILDAIRDYETNTNKDE